MAATARAMTAPAREKEREFLFTEKDFDRIRKFVKQHTGIKLSDAKMNMVYGRLSRRLRQLGIDSISAYMRLVEAPGSDELPQFINAMTTNLTAFFREKHHFEYLEQTLLPQLLRRNAQSRRLRIWSAGCSTGEEPYSLAMTLLSAVPRPDEWDMRILATDLDSNVLAHAQAGIYDAERIDGLDQAIKKRWFRRGRGSRAGSVRVSPELQALISFRQLNLMQDWPMKGPFDFIFCRNVVIYFDKPTQARLFDRYADILIPRGHVFLGHSESMFKVCDRFDLIGKTIYQKKD